tara:strand:+ start:182 stop:613 length:432 start_codon:yes stop_codon:yes gene_type:complete
MNKEVLLYFRTVADEDNDDNNGAQTSVVFPASKLRAMNPTADATLTLYFDSLRNTEGADDQADEITIADTVALTITANTHEAVMKSIVRAINGKKSNPKADGLLIVADDVTTNVADNTVVAQYVDTNITSCGAIATVAVHAGS